MVLLAMASARRSIALTNPYFVLDERMTDTLLAAAQRGVRVVALTPGKIDHNLVRSASRRDFGELLLGGVQIFEYRAALLHAKTLVIDGAWATIGSTNLDNRSFALNEELNVAVYDRGRGGAAAERLRAGSAARPPRRLRGVGQPRSEDAAIGMARAARPRPALGARPQTVANPPSGMSSGLRSPATIAFTRAWVCGRT